MNVIVKQNDFGMLIEWANPVSIEIESYLPIMTGLHKAGYLVLRMAGIPGVADLYGIKGLSLIHFSIPEASNTIWAEVKRPNKPVHSWDDALALSVDDVNWEPGQKAFHTNLKLVGAEHTYYIGVINSSRTKCFLIWKGLKEQRT